MQARYEQLVKSGATAISSDMLFGTEEAPKQQEQGRWSTPASLSALGEKLVDHVEVARASLGSKFFIGLNKMIF